VKSEIKHYLAEIGRRGGQKSKRALSSTEAKRMLRIREARRAYRDFYSQCFWSFSASYKIEEKDIPWLIEQLMKNGNRAAYLKGASLCR
jgi:hypothetical protein